MNDKLKLYGEKAFSEKRLVEVKEILNKYFKWSSVIDTCLRMIDSEFGDIKILFVSGGLYEQPTPDLFQLFVVQDKFRKYLASKQSESKNKDAEPGKGKFASIRENSI